MWLCGKYTIRSIVCEASCHLVTWSLRHSVTRSLIVATNKQTDGHVTLGLPGLLCRQLLKQNIKMALIRSSPHHPDVRTWARCLLHHTSQMLGYAVFQWWWMWAIVNIVDCATLRDVMTRMYSGLESHDIMRCLNVAAPRRSYFSHFFYSITIDNSLSNV